MTDTSKERCEALLREARALETTVTGPDWRLGTMFYRDDNESRAIELMPKLADLITALCERVTKATLSADHSHAQAVNDYTRRKKAEAALAEAVKVVRECANYIRSPLRMSDDVAEEARRDSIVGRAGAFLTKHGAQTNG